MKHFVAFLFFLGIVTTLTAQDDSVTVENDSSFIEEALEEYGYSTDFYEEKDAVGLPDTAVIVKRTFSQEQIEALKNDPGLQYHETPTVAESLWMRILRWIEEFFLYLLSQILTTEGSVNWVKLIFYILGIAAIVLITMMLLKVNAFKVFYSGQGANPVKHNVIEENIHEMDFEKLIQQARDQNDYRRAVRLVFLFSLKMLSDKHLIHWEQGKTNHDYVAELKETELKTGLNELSFYFDYAWYGNFTISAETFGKVETVFSAWRMKVR
ncbi:MAG TPA: DUF4129 domain-containing protein [Ohtaekwangia sp.]